MTGAYVAVAAPDLDAKFDPRTGDTGDWLGADGATSVPFPDGRVLWLFNDTFWRTSGSGVPADRTGSAFLRDSLAMQSTRDLTSAQVTFHRHSGGAEWFPVGVDHYAWPEGGLVVGSDLYVTSKRMSGAGGMGYEAGWCVHRVPDAVATPVESWAPALLYRSEDTDTRPILSLTDGGDGFVYAYGLKQRHGWRRARWAMADFTAGDLGAAQWDTGASWSTTVASARQLAESFSAADGSVYRRPDGLYVLVESSGAFPTLGLQVRTSATPGGDFHPPPPALQVGDRVTDTTTGYSGKTTASPTSGARTVAIDGLWGGGSVTRPVARLVAGTGSERVMYQPPTTARTYAGKAHPVLSSTSVLVTSYVDSTEWLDANGAPIPGGLAYDLSVYWPKFVRMFPTGSSLLDEQEGASAG